MYDVLVVGAGHAGTEAAAAASRRGARTLLLSFRRDMIGAMSCNPAIGGLGKGHIVREIDAFDGIMARAADAAAIHHRMLNRSKGAAVQGPRIQADRRLYARAVQAVLSREADLTIAEGSVDTLVARDGHVRGVQLDDGSIIQARTVVLATGTFLGATLFRGNDRDEGGRMGERPAKPLAAQLRALGLPMGRLKTGTPPRLRGRTIHWATLTEQPSEQEQWTMSPMTRQRALPQVACAITRTNLATHSIIRQGFHDSPLIGGAIDGVGPRYCPSIEDKVHRFGDRDGHQVFLEPEGLDDDLVYPNGLSTSLSVATQRSMINSIAGLERAEIAMPGYAVEYDYLDPRSLNASLGLDALRGLYCAGQINGTTGYEEAAGQGLIAGLNAAAEALNGEPVILDRASGYIGVMIDDLILQGVTEPYRMLTARAEFRLSLRADNAETRLGELARSAGCISDDRRRHQDNKRTELNMLRNALSHDLTSSDMAQRGNLVAQDGARRSAYDWLRSPGVAIRSVLDDDAGMWSDAVIGEIVEDARYAPYLERQADEIARMRRDEALSLPSTIRFNDIPGLSHEMVARLTEGRPASLAAAARIRGVKPAAVSAIYLYARRRAA